MDSPPYLDSPRPLAFAHRGGAYHPDIEGLENTLVAFAHAVDLGYIYLETDVHVTSDGQLLAFHDERLDRLTDQVGRVLEHRYDALAAALVGSSEPIPRLEDLLEELPDARFNVDLKAPEAVAPLADLVRRTGWHDRLCVGSFSDRRIARPLSALMAKSGATSPT